MLYIFSQDEQLLATLHPAHNLQKQQSSQQAFLQAEYPAEFAREPTTGCPYWDAVHREVLNGENTFSFTIPADQANAAFVQEGNLVAFKDLDSAWQFFEIKRLVDKHGDGLTKTAFCEHVFYELLDDIITDKRPAGSAILALSSALEGTRWQVGIVDDLGTNSTNFYYENALSAVQKVANTWKGELRWRIVITGGIIERYVDLLAMRGTDTGKQFAYAKDIKSIEREVDLSGVCTALYGRGKGVETESGEGYGRRLTFADVVWSTATGNPVDKPAGQEWVGDPNALAQWGRPGGRHRFGVFTDEDETDAAVLLQKTWDELQRQKTPQVTYRLDAMSLEELTGYEHEAVRLGDLVRVIDREFKPELAVSARVIEIERNLLEPDKTKVVLGNFAPSIVEAQINVEKKVDNLANKPYNTKWLDGKISVLQNEIENTSAFVFITPNDGILIMDAPTFEQATKAMKLGGGIFAIANSKTGDQWNWRTFGDGAGFTADEIRAGTLTAGLVEIKSQDEKTVITTDGMRVYDADNNLRAHVGQYEAGKYGVKILNGEIYATSIKSGTPEATTQYIQIDPGGYLRGYGRNGKVIEITTGTNQGSLSLLDDGTERAQILLNGATTKELLLDGKNGSGIFLDAYTGESLALGPYGGQADVRGITHSGRFRYSIQPFDTETADLGSSTYKWYRIYGKYVYQGDICFTEKSCAICDKEFRPGDIISLVIIDIDDDGSRSIPIHQSCVGVSKTIEIEVPEMVTEYEFDEITGTVRQVVKPKLEEVKITKPRIKKEYKLDKQKGIFKHEKLEKKVNQEEAIEYETVRMLKPVYKKKVIKL